MLNMIRSWLRLRADRRATAAERRAFARLDAESRYRMAMDAGLGVYELEMVVANAARTRRLLGGTIAALGSTEQDVARRHPLALRDLAATCSRCGSALTCGRAILDGTVPETLDRYCANAAELRHLAAGVSRGH